MKLKEFISKLANTTVASAFIPNLLSCEVKSGKISGLKNWAGNYTYTSEETKFVDSVDELKKIIVKLKKVKALGTQHCFNDIADTSGTQLSTQKLDSVIELNIEKQTVLVFSGIKYGDLGVYLNEKGWALHNLASLPHISVGGACATATHGSGVSNGNLASAIIGFEILKPDGEIKWVDPDNNPDLFYGGVVSLGALGIMTKIKLKIQPTFNVEQRVFENLSMEALKENFNAIMSSGYSVSLFTHWLDRNINQIWIKSKSGTYLNSKKSFYGSTPAIKDLHPIKANSPINCTPQMGVSGPWHERLPHFKMEFTPSNGDELQSEYFVSTTDAYQAIMAIEAIHSKISPILFVTEIRSIASDNFWMSMAYKRESISIHFTWKPVPEAVLSLLPEIENALAPFDVRPHWGKIHSVKAKQLKERYPKYTDFCNLREEIDPKGVLLNKYLKRTIQS